MIDILVQGQQSSIPEWITAITALFAALVVLYEFYIRHRPYIKVEIEIQNLEKTPGIEEFTFLGKIINFGSVPALVFVKKKEDIVIKIGDEKYPSKRETPHGYAFPHESQPMKVHLGDINETGISKLINGEYEDNTSYVEVTIQYCSYRFKHRKYKFYSKYKLDFFKQSNGKIGIMVSLEKQEFI